MSNNQHRKINQSLTRRGLIGSASLGVMALTSTANPALAEKEKDIMQV